VRTALSRLDQFPRSLLYALAAGLILRVLFVTVHDRPLISDEREYDRLAFQLASTGSYCIDGIPTSYRPIGYPAILGVIYFVAGHHPQAVKYLQACTDITTALLIYLLLAAYSMRVRVLAAGLWAGYLPAILYSNFLLSESLFTFILVLMAYLLMRGSGNKLGAALIGICGGVLVLMKPSVIVFLALLPLVMAMLHQPLKNLVPAAIAFLFVVFPWSARNYVTFGTSSLSSNGGINLLIGNNPEATGAYSVRFDTTILLASRGEFETDRTAYRLATRYIFEHPGMFAVNGIKKFAHLFESEGGLLVWTLYQNPEDTATRYTSKYRSIPILWICLVNLPYFIVLLFGTISFLAADKNQLWWLTTSLIAGWLLIHLTFFGGGRFHFPLIPFILIYAALGLADLRAMMNRLSYGHRIAASVLVLGFVSIWVAEGVMVYHG